MTIVGYNSILSQLFAWLDRTVVLHWIKGGGSIYEWLADPESWPTEILTEPS